MNIDYLDGFTGKLPTQGEDYFKFYRITRGNDELIIVFRLSKQLGWQLKGVNIAPYKIKGKNSIEWHNSAVKLRNDGYDLPAALHDLYAHNSLMIPYFKHELYDSIFEGAVEIEEFNKSLPLELQTDLGILDVYTIRIHYNDALETFGYTIGYLTNVEVLDRKHVHEECLQIRKVLFEQGILEPTDNMIFYAHKTTPISINDNVESEDVVRIEFIN